MDSQDGRPGRDKRIEPRLAPDDLPIEGVLSPDAAKLRKDALKALRKEISADSLSSEESGIVTHWAYVPPETDMHPGSIIRVSRRVDPEIPPFRSHGFVLLTGAGFSYPFGGLLASEFWDELFRRPEVQGNSKLRDLLLETHLFEDALSRVRIDPNYTPADAEALSTAVEAVFRRMDRDIGSDHAWRDGPLNIYGFQDFLKRFQCHRQDPHADAGFIFTLNQDFLIERKWYNFDHWGFRPSLPGVPSSGLMHTEGRSWFSTRVGELDEATEITIPFLPTFELAGHTNYIKLHGSINWRKTDGSRALVVGSGKAQQIQDMALLRGYAKLLSLVLSQAHPKLMIIGYSFQDEHINRIISKACGGPIRIHIWDKYASQVLERIRTRDDCGGIMNRIEGIWTRPLQDVWPANQEESGLWLEMRERFFEVPLR